MDTLTRVKLYDFGTVFQALSNGLQIVGLAAKTSTKAGCILWLSVFCMNEHTLLVLLRHLYSIFELSQPKPGKHWDYVYFFESAFDFLSNGPQYARKH